MFDERESQILRNLVSFADAKVPLWRTDEFPAIWNDQLSCSLVRFIQEMDIVDALEAQQLCNSQVPVINSLRDLFLRERPPLRLLVIIDSWADALLQSQYKVWPPEIVIAIRDIARLHKRASRGLLHESSERELRQRVRELLSCSWIDDQLRERVSSLMAGHDGTD